MHECGINNIKGWMPCVTLYTLKTCWQRLHPSAKARKKRAQLDMLNTSSRHGWRGTWGGRSSSLPRPPKATETKGEGQECWGNSERSDSGIELLCIFFDFPFKHLEWIDYQKMAFWHMHFACYLEIRLGDGVKEPNHGNSAPLLPEVQHWWNHRWRFLLQRKIRIAWMQVPLSGVAALSGAMRSRYQWNEVICCRGWMTLEKTKRVCCNYLKIL